MALVFDVNTQAVIKFSKKLDLISKNALPRAVRNTLNDMAFDVKKRTIIEEFDKSFTVRNKTFPRRFSRVKPADMGRISNMRATVGMTDQGRRGMTEQAGEDMRQQQVGGRIGGRAMIAQDTARDGGQNSNRVSPRNRLKKVRQKIVADTKLARTNKPKQRFIQTAIYAVSRFGSGAVIKHTREDGKTFLYRIQRGGNDIKTRRFNLKVTPLYSVQRGRAVNIRQPVRFTQRAALRSQKRANQIFIRHARERIRRGR